MELLVRDKVMSSLASDGGALASGSAAIIECRPSAGDGTRPGGIWKSKLGEGGVCIRAPVWFCGRKNGSCR